MRYFDPFIASCKRNSKHTRLIISLILGFTTLGLLIAAYLQVITQPSSDTSSGSGNNDTDVIDLVSASRPLRRITTSDYAAALLKGVVTTCLLESSILGADTLTNGPSQSQWLTQLDLEAWAWTVSSLPRSKASYLFGPEGELEDAIQYYNLPTDDSWALSDWRYNMVSQSSMYISASGQVMPATLGQASQLFLSNPPTMIVTEMFSPRYTMREELDADPSYELPLLYHWSDIVFLHWYHFSGPRGAPLSTDFSGTARVPFPDPIFMSNVINEKCKGMFQYIWSRDDTPFDYGYENGRKFMPDDGDFAAILACPNSDAIARFFIDHKAQFGVVDLAYIDVWLSETPDDYETWNVVYKPRLLELDPASSEAS